MKMLLPSLDRDFVFSILPIFLSGREQKERGGEGGRGGGGGGGGGGEIKEGRKNESGKRYLKHRTKTET